METRRPGIVTDDAFELMPPRRQILILVLDKSGSMSEEVPRSGGGSVSRASLVMEQLRTFLQDVRSSIPPDVLGHFHVGVIEFDERPTVILQPTDIHRLPAPIEGAPAGGALWPDGHSIVPDGNTNMTAALEAALDMARSVEHFRDPVVVALFSDGKHNVEAAPPPSAAVKALRDHSYQVVLSAGPQAGTRPYQVRVYAAALWSRDADEIRASFGAYGRELVRTIVSPTDLQDWLVAITSPAR